MTSSFKAHSELRPGRYRTPSPPYDAFEPISPISCPERGHSSPPARRNGHNYEDESIEHTRALSRYATREAEHSRGHSYTIGRLSNVPLESAKTSQIEAAFNTAPCASPRRPDANVGSMRSKKRTRSENSVPAQITKRQKANGPRPATSAGPSSDRSLLDAELLLHFSRQAADAESSIGEGPSPSHEHENPPKVRSKSRKFPVTTDGKHQEAPSCVSPTHESFLPHKKGNTEGSPTGQPHVPVGQLVEGSSDGRSVRVTGEGRDSPLVSKDCVLDQATLIERITDQAKAITKTMHGSSPEEGRTRNDIVEDFAKIIQGQSVTYSSSAPNTDCTLSSLSGSGTRDLIHRSPSPRLSMMEPPENNLNTPCAAHPQEGVPGKENRHTSQSLNGIKAASEATSHAQAPNAICASCTFVKDPSKRALGRNLNSWISCDHCKDWFHYTCAGFENDRAVRSVDKFRCEKCAPVHGATTYVRKSARAHSAIDYAGLNQGIVKTSDETPEHHYIQPLKSGKLSFQAETFPRLRPELVTAEFFRAEIGMKEPIIVPAAWNPQAPSGTRRDERGEAVKCTPNTKDPGIYGNESFSSGYEIAVDLDDGQDVLGMVLPRGLTVRNVANLIGQDEKLEVIDVKSQNGEKTKWTMKRWADYYEHSHEYNIVRNVISLEFSQTKLGRLVKRPKIVRDLDLQDAVWPSDLVAKGDSPKVKLYCLMSVADCFTDFHIDFGGSSVFYHILKGRKTFLFVPPKEKNLKKYEEWCMSPAQNWTFFADRTNDCCRVDLCEGDTMLIPSGWIHAVWTPEDSLVIGGNFLTRESYAMQFRVAQIEKTTGVARKFRYPHFQRLHWYAALQYINDDPVPEDVLHSLENGFSSCRALGQELHADSSSKLPFDGNDNNSRRIYSQAELEGLPDLLRYLTRTVLIDNGVLHEGITAEARNAVKRSIPRNDMEPTEVVKSFAIWIAWKVGHQCIPHWAYPDAVLDSSCMEKQSHPESRRLAEKAATAARRKYGITHNMTVSLHDVETPGIQSFKSSDHLLQPSQVFEGHDESKANIQTAAVVLSREQSPIKDEILARGRRTTCEECHRKGKICRHQPATDHAPPVAPNVAESISHRTDIAIDARLLRAKLSNIGDLFNTASSRSQNLGVTQRTFNKRHDASMSSSTEVRGSGPDENVEKSQNTPPFFKPMTSSCSQCCGDERRIKREASGGESANKDMAFSTVGQGPTELRSLSSCTCDLKRKVMKHAESADLPISSFSVERDLSHPKMHKGPNSSVLLHEVDQPQIGPHLGCNGTGKNTVPERHMNGRTLPMLETRKSEDSHKSKEPLNINERSSERAARSVSKLKGTSHGEEAPSRLVREDSPFQSKPSGPLSHLIKEGTTSKTSQELVGTCNVNDQGTQGMRHHGQIQIHRRNSTLKAKGTGFSSKHTTSPGADFLRLDADSRKLIRDLQAQDLGLRKRG